MRPYCMPYDLAAPFGQTCNNRGHFRVNLTDKMRRLTSQLRTDETPSMLATTFSDGLPNAGYRSTMMVLDKESFA